ncbi:rhombosortase [Microbulbifer sp. SA54]|uniref:rhombosortase n=1 Tax=Microbulbifer sp. SA54 TaxID=3401577 RepID=UPI003AAB15EC
MHLALIRSGIAGPLILLAVIVLVAAMPAAETWLVYNRALIDGGEVWRLLTGHLTHTNSEHLLLNTAGLVLLWILHGQHYRLWPFFGMTALLCLVTGVALYLFSPGTEIYLGLSGVLHGLIIWGGLLDIRARWRTGYLLVAGTWIKVGLEQWFGASADTAGMIGAEVAIDAHLWGTAAGMLLGLPALERRAGPANKEVSQPS